MVKHTQTIRRQIADELFECVWPFCEIGAKRVNGQGCYKDEKKLCTIPYYYYLNINIIIFPDNFFY